MKKTITKFMSCVALLGCTALQGAIYFPNADEDPIYLNVDYLFWKVEEDQTYYAVATTGSFTSGFAGLNYTTAEQCPKASSGVRIKAGYLFCNEWDTTLAFTHLSNCTFSSVAAPNHIATTAIFQLASGDFNFFGSTAASTLDVKLNAVDWEIGYTYELNDCMSIRPNIGIKWGQIKQTQNIRYTGTPGVPTATVKKCNKFSGVGPRIGVDSQWYFHENFSIIGIASGALLAGKFNVSADYVLNTTAPVTPTPQTFTPRFTICRKLVAPTAQIFLGLGWESSCSCVDFDIALGYEAQYWWNQWQSIPSVIGSLATTPGHGDLSTSGLTLKFGVHF